MIIAGTSDEMLTCHRYVILPHPTERRVLMNHAPGGWTLPSVLTASHHVGDAMALYQGLRAQFGLDVSLLRSVDHRFDPETGRRTLVYWVENLSPGWTPPAGAAWVDKVDVRGLSLDKPEQRDLLIRWFSEAALPGDTAMRWLSPGWYRTVQIWIEDQLRRHGVVPTGRLQPVRSWDRCSLMRIQTTMGIAYFKAVPPMFPHEPALAAWLDQRFHGRVPEVLGADQEQGWYLMRAFEGAPLHEHDDRALWEKALAEYAEIQMASANYQGELADLGCPHRGLPVLLDQALYLLTDVSTLTVQPAAALFPYPVGLDADAVQVLQNTGPRLGDISRELDAFGLPDALDHGDFWTGNVFTDGSRFTLIDWSDSSMTHPFFSMPLFLEYREVQDWPPADRRVWQRLRDAYLEPWTGFLPMTELRRAFHLAYPLGFLHAALTYHTYVLPYMESPWEMEEMVPWCLGRMASLLAE